VLSDDSYKELALQALANGARVTDLQEFVFQDKYFAAKAAALLENCEGCESKDCTCLDKCFVAIKDDKQIMMQAVEARAQNFQFASQMLLNDPELLLTAIKTFPRAVWWAGRRLRRGLKLTILAGEGDAADRSLFNVLMSQSKACPAELLAQVRVCLSSDLSVLTGNPFLLTDDEQLTDEEELSGNLLL
jgi:hypothetical protein